MKGEIRPCESENIWLYFNPGHGHHHSDLNGSSNFCADDDVVPDMNLRWKINNKLG